ncbi:MAG: transposase [Saprospiraceae bacterium]|nr:transposase [Saprospiraceae bacterium]
MMQLPLYDEVKQFFPYHRKELVNKFILIAQCLFQSRTVILYKMRNEAGIATGKKDLVKENVYKCFIRFFSMKCKDAFCLGIIYLIINILGEQNTIYIVMDRTNWKIGKVNINILYIGLILPNGSFIPILFDPLEKRGNSNTDERKDILARFCELWQQKGQQKSVLLADREFIGITWFKAILDAGFSFVIRLRMKDYFGELCEQRGKSADKMNSVIEKAVKRYGYFRSKIVLAEQELYYIVLPIQVGKQRKSEEKYLILLSDNPDVQQVSKHYQMRWKIEVFFFHIKTNGFNLEDINLKNLEKVQIMLAILAFLYVVIQKEHLINAKSIRLKTYKEGTTKAISIFRNSYDDLKLKILNLNDLSKFLLQIINPFVPFEPNFFQDCKYLNLKSV